MCHLWISSLTEIFLKLASGPGEDWAPPPHSRHISCRLHFPQFPFRMHVSLQLAIAFYLLFISPLFLFLPFLPHTLSLSVLLTTFTTLSSPLNLKPEFNIFFSNHCLATVSQAYIFYNCLFFTVSMNVCLFSLS